MSLIMYGDSGRSMDLFHVIPARIIDPFLYVEHDGRRVAIIGSSDHETIRAAAPDVEVIDSMIFGRLEIYASGRDWNEVQFEVSRRALRELGVTEATVSWDFPVAMADLL